MTTVIRWKCCANSSIDTSRIKREIGKTSPKVNSKLPAYAVFTVKYARAVDIRSGSPPLELEWWY